MHKNNPKVSIIIPMYNYGNYIGECIKSCILQTFENIEIIIIDDASTDGSSMILRNIEKDLSDNRLKCIYLDDNKGYSHAKNVGIKNSKSELIVHLDADDMLTKDSIEIRYNSIINENVEFVHGVGLNFYGDKDYLWCCNHIDELKSEQVKIHAQGVMLKKDLFRRYGLYEESLKDKSDKSMWIRLRDIAKIEIKKIQHPVAFYRKHQKSMMSTRNHNSDYENTVKLFNKIIDEKMKNGINKENTIFLTD